MGNCSQIPPHATDSSDRNGPAYAVATNSATGLLSQLLPLALYQHGRLKFAESERA